MIFKIDRQLFNQSCPSSVGYFFFLCCGLRSCAKSKILYIIKFDIEVNATSSKFTSTPASLRHGPMAEAGARRVEEGGEEGNEQKVETDSAPVSPSEDSPSCPARPGPGDCPFPQWSLEWKNWYAHFGNELARWGRFLSQKVSRTAPDAGSIKWKALGLHDVRKLQDPVTITRISHKPVVKTADSGIIVTEDCDIVTYEGTGVLINKGKGVVINAGSGIVINHSKGTCNNAADGIIVSLGKGLLVNTGSGYGIVKSCPDVVSGEHVVLNEAGGILIKDTSELLRICTEERANTDSVEEEDRSSSSTSDSEDENNEDLSTLDDEVVCFDTSESEASFEDYWEDAGIFLTEASDFTTSADDDDDDSDGTYLSDDGTSETGQSDIENNNTTAQVSNGPDDGGRTNSLEDRAENIGDTTVATIIPHQMASDLFPTDAGNESDLESESPDVEDHASADDEESSSAEPNDVVQDVTISSDNATGGGMKSPGRSSATGRSRSRYGRAARACIARKGKRQFA